MDFAKNQYIVSLEQWKINYLHKVKFTRNDGETIESGTDIEGCHIMKVTSPEGTLPHLFGLC
jgi:hypothetical protein